ncbi:MAG: hypothetical protein WBE76_05585, partial [Terracidiphilus sp.]
RWTLERFHNSRVLFGVVKGGFFLRKKPLEGSGFGIQQLWNRCSRLFIRNHNYAVFNQQSPGSFLTDLLDLTPKDRAKSPVAFQKES